MVTITIVFLVIAAVYAVGTLSYVVADVVRERRDRKKAAEQENR